MALQMDKLKMSINSPKFSYVAVVLWTSWTGITIIGTDCWALWLEVWIFPSSIQSQFPNSSMTMISPLEMASLRKHGVKISGTMNELNQIQLHRPWHSTIGLMVSGDTYTLLKSPNSYTASLWFWPSACTSGTRRLAERSCNITKRGQRTTGDLESSSVTVINCVSLDKSLGFQASISI